MQPPLTATQALANEKAARGATEWFPSDALANLWREIAQRLDLFHAVHKIGGFELLLNPIDYDRFGPGLIAVTDWPARPDPSVHPGIGRLARHSGLAHEIRIEFAFALECRDCGRLIPNPEEYPPLVFTARCGCVAGGPPGTMAPETLPGGGQ